MKPLGIETPGRVSVMFFPVTDSLGGTIAENRASYAPGRATSLMNDVGSRVAGALPLEPGRGGELLMSRRSGSSNVNRET
jgi:hypothetical protein